MRFPEFKIIVKPKKTPFVWVFNTNSVTIHDLLAQIRQIYSDNKLLIDS